MKKFLKGGSIQGQIDGDVGFAGGNKQDTKGRKLNIFSSNDFEGLN